jgi:hypothetical protein
MDAQHARPGASRRDGHPDRAGTRLYPPTVTGGVLAEIHRSAVQYVVVQWDVLDTPIGNTRFDDSEPAQYYNSPLSAASLSKFDASPEFREIYVVGSLRVYQVVGSTGGQ